MKKITKTKVTKRKKTTKTKKKIDFSAIKKSVDQALKKTTKPEEKTTSKVKKVTTGIEGLNEALSGGYPEKSLVIVSGSTGAGKSTFAMQFLIDGANKGENGVYITLEEEPAHLIKDFEDFNWDIKKLVDENKIIITKPAIYKFEPLLETIKNTVERSEAKRLVIDSSSLLSVYFENPFEVRRGLAELDKKIKKLNITTLAISEIMEESHLLSTTGVEEFIADGVIVLHIIKNENEYTRALSVRKMRSIEHSLKIMPMQITKNGIIVYPKEEVFSEV
ncbi:MAG: ATPase domain-containing protein [Candidatus Micrarchaeota archaeon]